MKTAEFFFKERSMSSSFSVTVSIHKLLENVRIFM